jgi:hypothetical protein
VDIQGEVYAVARWLDVRTKNVNTRMGDPDALPSVAETQEKIRELVRDKLAGFVGSASADFAQATQGLEAQRLAMVEHHRMERRSLQVAQDERRTREARARAQRFRTGILGLWDRITGQHAKLRRENEEQAGRAAERDADEKQAIVVRQLEERRHLQRELRWARRLHVHDMARLYREIAEVDRSKDRVADRASDDSLSPVRRRRRSGPELSR